MNDPSDPAASTAADALVASEPVASQSLTVPIQRLPHGADVALPAYQTAHAAGMDLHAALPHDQPVTLDPGDIALIPCGFALALPIGYEAQVRPRSGLAVKHGISMPNAPGTIDADYRGEVKVPLVNLGRAPFTVERHERIAQMVIAPITRAAWMETDRLEITARGANGFGHTGR